MEQTPLGAERVLFVHAHPDDESISTGGTIAMLVDRGAAVTVLTCTRGELGEVVAADLSHLESPAQLGDYRSSELMAALRVLGVVDHRFLGAPDARAAGRPPRRYSDSGMVWAASGRAAAPATLADDAFGAAPFGDVAADIATVIEQVKPDAVVSYNENGGYGHPDHVRAHDAAKRAAEVMNVAFWAIEPDAVEGQLEVDVSRFRERKTEAMRAHRSQLTVTGTTFTQVDGISMPIESFERYSSAQGQPAAPQWKDAGFGAHVLVWLLALVVGAAIGGIATVDHQYVWRAGWIAFPLGIVATLLIVAALLVGLRFVFPGRMVAMIAAVGVVGVIAALSLSGGNGSVLVPANPAGYLLTFGPALIALVVVVWPAVGTFSRDKIEPRPEPKGTPSL